MHTDLIQLPPERRVRAVIDYAFDGIHHVRNFAAKDVDSPHPSWACTVGSNLCTVDHDNLTRLVLAAAEYGVRVDIRPAGPRNLKLFFWPRFSRDGAFWQRAPRLAHWQDHFQYETRLTQSNQP